jgi:hypothetical protein
MAQKLILLNIAMILLTIFIINSCIARIDFCDFHHKNEVYASFLSRSISGCSKSHFINSRHKKSQTGNQTGL